MIYGMAADVQTALTALRYPVAVQYVRAMPRLDGQGIASRSHTIDICRDARQGDTIGGPQGQAALVRGLGVEARIYIRSGLAGARVSEHEAECDLIVDALLLALQQWIVAKRLGVALVVREARYLSLEELDANEAAAGVVYSLRFVVPRGIAKRYYDGYLMAAGAVTAVDSATRVTRDGSTFETVPFPEPTPPD